MNPFTPNELQRLNNLGPNSPEQDFDWAKARLRAYSAEINKLKVRIDALEDLHDLSVGKQDQSDV